MKKLAILGWTFFWISSITLGGGMAMLPLMEREFVERRKWLTADEILDVVAVMQSLPGLIAINMAVLVGYRVKGVAGAAVASLASVISPFAVIAAIAGFLSTLSSSTALDHVFLGVRAGTAALILVSLLKLVRSALQGWFARALAIASFIAAIVLRVDITLIVLFGFAVGLGHVGHVALRSRKGGRT